MHHPFLLDTKGERGPREAEEAGAGREEEGKKKGMNECEGVTFWLFGVKLGHWSARLSQNLVRRDKQ